MDRERDILAGIVIEIEKKYGNKISETAIYYNLLYYLLESKKITINDIRETLEKKFGIRYN